MNVNNWALEYEMSRYLREQSEDTLQKRYDALIANLWSTDADGKVVPPRNPDHRRELLRLITHTLCEKRERSGDNSISFDEKAARELASKDYKIPKLKTPFVGTPSGFAKFGKKHYLHEAYEKGKLRVAPAAAFTDPSLNAAQQDDELLHWTTTPNQHLIFTLYGKDPDGNEVEIPVQKKEMFRGMSVPNFYVWCCGFGFDARLFHEFEADAVIVVRNMDEFRSRFAAAMEKELPGWNMRDGPVAYFDPYSVQRDQLIPIFVKNMRYLHQNEYRFAWSPSRKATVGGAVYPVLGPLDDIAEFYELDTSA